jgi:hypothetical protein
MPVPDPGGSPGRRQCRAGAGWHLGLARTAAPGCAVQTLSDPGQDAYAPQVAVNPGGDAVVTWETFGVVQASAGP